MATSCKTVTFPFTTRTTALATNTTLGTATEVTFSRTITLEPTRLIRHVRYEIVAHDEFAAAADFDGLRVGSKINAVAQSDTDITLTAVDSGDHETFEAQFDATAYWTTNDPGTNTFTAEVHLRFATESAQNVNGISVLVHITYTYDDTQTTQYKTVCVPIQSEHGLISTTYVEVGTGGTSPAPANQIPAWSTELPEGSKTILEEWVDVTGMRIQGGGTVTPALRIDGATDNTRWGITDALVTSRPYIDRLSTNALAGAGGAFEVKCDVASKLELVGGFAWVTYAFDPASATHWVCQRVPLANTREGGYTTLDSTAGDADRLHAVAQIQEPTTITMKPSGVVVYTTSNNSSRSVLTPGQTARSYAFSNNSPRAAMQPIVHRGDHSSSTWALARGRNELTVDIYGPTEGFTLAQWGGYALINYTCGLAAGGCGQHARSTVWGVAQLTDSAGSARDIHTPTAPFIPESTYSLIGSYVEELARFNHASNVLAYVGARRASGEGSGGGWQVSAVNANNGGVQDVGTDHYCLPTSDWWRHGGHSDDSRRLALEASRDWLVQQGTAGSALANTYSACHWVTYHAISYTISGVITIDGVVAPDGEIVILYGDDSVNGMGERYSDTTTSGGTGTYSFTVDTDLRNWVVFYIEDTTRQGANQVAVGTGQDIALYTTGGGGPDAKRAFTKAQLLGRVSSCG